MVGRRSVYLRPVLTDFGGHLRGQRGSEVQQYDCRSCYELEITADKLTEHNPLRIPIERLAARSSISPDEALYILRASRYGENTTG